MTNVSGIGKVYKEHKGCVFIEVSREKMTEAMEMLKKRGFTRISSITGYDSGKGFEVIYHFDSPEHRLVSIKARLPAANPQVESITRHFRGAELFERELMEMTGIEVLGHPNPGKLFLCEDSPVCPLRKMEEKSDKEKQERK